MVVGCDVRKTEDRLWSARVGERQRDGFVSARAAYSWATGILLSVLAEQDDVIERQRTIITELTQTYHLEHAN